MRAATSSQQQPARTRINGAFFHMFGGLKEKLKAARNRLGTSIEGVAAKQELPVPETRNAEPETPKAQQKTTSPTFVDKFKVLITRPGIDSLGKRYCRSPL